MQVAQAKAEGYHLTTAFLQDGEAVIFTTGDWYCID